MKNKIFTFFVIFSALVSGVAHAGQWELRKNDSSAPGGYRSLGIYSSSKECAKARKKAVENDPKGDYGCMKKYS